MFYPSGTTLFDLFHDFGSKWARKRGRAIENGKGEFTNQALHKQKSELFDQTIEGPLLQSRISLNAVQNNNEIFFYSNGLFFIAEFVKSVVHYDLKKEFYCIKYL